MSKLVLIRGLPGSGKSTMAKAMKGYVHVEADMYFNITGEYIFEPTKIKEAHKWCQLLAQNALEHGKNVVVSNTFVRQWEIMPYMFMGADDIEILVATGDYGSIHNVPEFAIQRMKDNWESL